MCRYKLNNCIFKLFTVLFLYIGIAEAGFVATRNTGICDPNHQDTNVAYAVKWYRNSAEKKALYNQGYSIGAAYIRGWVEKTHPKKNTWGVILDIDETVLDNTWYLEACKYMLLNGGDFNHYVVIPHKSVAEPGVVAFTSLVHALGGYVSMVTNRDGTFKDGSGSVMEATIVNLKDQNIYFDQVIFSNNRDSKNPRDKNPRFEAIKSGKYDDKQMVWSKQLPSHEVIAYFGDNIQDFPNLKQETVNSLDGNDNVFKKFGNGYFIFPNPIYGSWTKNASK